METLFSDDRSDRNDRNDLVARIELESISDDPYARIVSVVSIASVV